MYLKSAALLGKLADGHVMQVLDYIKSYYHRCAHILTALWNLTLIAAPPQRVLCA